MAASEWILTLVAVTAQTLANFALSLGLKRWKQVHDWRQRLLDLAQRPLLPVAIGLLALHFFTWCHLLKTAHLSVVVPLTAFTHVLNAVLAGPLLGEMVSPQRWCGTLLIVSGILVIVH